MIKIKKKQKLKKYIFRHIFCYLIDKFCKVDNKKIVMTNPLTWQYADNPKYIANELVQRPEIKDYKLIWLINKSTDRTQIPATFKQIKYDSLRALYEFATAKIWIMNSHAYLPLKSGLKKKKETFYIQTWHGSMGIKKCDADTAKVYEKLNNELKWQIKSSSLFDYIPVDNDFEKKVYVTQHRGYGQIEKIGKARDSIFYQNHEPIIKKIKEYYNIPKENKILLYAPTWRPDGRTNCFNIDIRMLKRALKKRFGGEWSILIRAHSRMKSIYNLLFDSNEAINASSYIDMQELLVAANILISDYSSCIPEYVILKKPSFIYASDFEYYNNNNGLYYPLSELPGPIAYDNGELLDNILNFDEALYKQKAEKFLQKMGHKDDEKSCVRIVDFILEKTRSDDK